jgi:hypothetical protein
VRKITGTRIAEALAKRPEIYSGAKRCMDVLPAVRQRVEVALRTLGRLYPEARFPPITIAVGRGKPVGVGSPGSGVQIGLEARCATDWLNPSVEDRFVHVIAHEYAHVQQVPALVDDENPTMLEMSLIEGAAEFTAELISGNVSNLRLGSRPRGAKRKSRPRSSPTKTRPISPPGSTTVRPNSPGTLATGLDIASSSRTTSMPTTSARPFTRFWK